MYDVYDPYAGMTYEEVKQETNKFWDFFGFQTSKREEEEQDLAEQPNTEEKINNYRAYRCKSVFTKFLFPFLLRTGGMSCLPAFFTIFLSLTIPNRSMFIPIAGSIITSLCTLGNFAWCYFDIKRIIKIFGGTSTKERFLVNEIQYDDQVQRFCEKIDVIKTEDDFSKILTEIKKIEKAYKNNLKYFHDNEKQKNFSITIGTLLFLKKGNIYRSYLNFLCANVGAIKEAKHFYQHKQNSILSLNKIKKTTIKNIYLGDKFFMASSNICVTSLLDYYNSLTEVAAKFQGQENILNEIRLDQETLEKTITFWAFMGINKGESFLVEIVRENVFGEKEQEFGFKKMERGACGTCLYDLTLQQLCNQIKASLQAEQEFICKYNFTKKIMQNFKYLCFHSEISGLQNVCLNKNEQGIITQINELDEIGELLNFEFLLPQPKDTYGTFFEDDTCKIIKQNLDIFKDLLKHLQQVRPTVDQSASSEICIEIK